MNIYDFISQERLDDLPQDPQMAFAEFVRHSQDGFKKQTASLDLNEQYDWHEYFDARFSLMNIVLAAAKRWAIDPFDTMQVPKIHDDNKEIVAQFFADLDFYMTQVALDNVIRNRTDTVKLSSTAKDRIRQHIHHLKNCIDESGLEDSRKKSLLKKLAEFEAKLDNSRLNLLSTTWLTIQILAIPGAMWASADAVSKLISNINQTIAVEKSIEDEERKLPAPEAPKKLIPPRTEDIDIENKSDGWGNVGDDTPF